MKNESFEFFHLQLIDLGLAVHIDDYENRERKMGIHIPSALHPYLAASRKSQRHLRTRHDHQQRGACDTIDSLTHVPELELTAVHVGTRGYRGPHLLRTHRCDYQDDLWVAALIVIEIALGVCVYTNYVKSLTPIVSKENMLKQVTKAVFNGTYIPWEALSETYPLLTTFLRRITRDTKPYIETAMDALRFICNKDNEHVFKPVDVKQKD